VAFAVRCALRSRPRYKGPEAEAIDLAIQLATTFAQGGALAPAVAESNAKIAYAIATRTTDPSAEKAVWAAGHAAQSANAALHPKSWSIRDVASAAHQAATTSNSATLVPDPILVTVQAVKQRNAQRADYTALVRSSQGPSGMALDISESGPLGPFWPAQPEGDSQTPPA